MTTSVITNVQALSALLAFCKENGFDNEPAISKMSHHLDVLRGTKNGTSTTDKNRSILNNMIIPWMRQRGRSVTCSEILGEFATLRSTSKVYAILKLGLEDGTLGYERGEKPSAPTKYFVK